MKRLAPLILLTLSIPALAQSALAQPAPAPPGGEGAGRAQRAYANPSALIAADIAFARLAREKGQWSAFREMADDAAEMFEPARVLAKTALKDRADPSVPVQWATRTAWISCDGSAGLTYGGWTGASGGSGEYVTVWQRQLKGKLPWKWLLDDGASLPRPLATADWAEGKVADCPARRGPDGGPGGGPDDPGHKGKKPEKRKDGDLPPLRPLAGPLPATDAPPGADSKQGQSRDGTLAWRSTVMPDGSRRFAAWMWKDGQMREVVARAFRPDGA